MPGWCDTDGTGPGCCVRWFDGMANIELLLGACCPFVTLSFLAENGVGMGWLQRTLFSIKAGAAADLRAFSAFAGEEELLMPAGTVYEVLNVKRLARLLLQCDKSQAYLAPLLRL